MADATVFGSHTVVAQPDLGAPVGLALSAGSTSRYAGTVHLTAMPLGERSLTVTGTCAETTVATTAAVTVVGADITPPSVRVTHPAYNGPAAAIASATDPKAFTVSISGDTSDPQSGMVGGQTSVAVALAADGPGITARPGRQDDWTTWTVDALPLPIPPSPPAADTASLGTFPLFVWATDAAGNTTPTPLVWGFEAIQSWVPTTLEERHHHAVRPPAPPGQPRINALPGPSIGPKGGDEMKKIVVRKTEPVRLTARCSNYCYGCCCCL